MAIYLRIRRVAETESHATNPARSKGTPTLDGPDVQRDWRTLSGQLGQLAADLRWLLAYELAALDVVVAAGI